MGYNLVVGLFKAYIKGSFSINKIIIAEI